MKVLPKSFTKTAPLGMLPVFSTDDGVMLTDGSCLFHMLVL